MGLLFCYGCFILFFFCFFFVCIVVFFFYFFFFQAEDGIRDGHVTGVQTCALPISLHEPADRGGRRVHRAAGARLLSPPAPAGDRARDRARHRARAIRAGLGQEIGRASCRERV